MRWSDELPFLCLQAGEWSLRRLQYNTSAGTGGSREAPQCNLSRWQAHTRVRSPHLYWKSNFEMQFEMGCACRHGEAPVVADVLIAVVRSSDIADARDLTAVLIARGCVCGPHLLS